MRSKSDQSAIIVGYRIELSLSFACLALFFCASFSSCAVASDGSFLKGMESYKSKDYKQAIVLLSKAALKDPYNPELHYYLANSYIFQKDGKNAIKEYSTCFDLEPLGTFGQYSRKALLGFGARFQGLVTASTSKRHGAPDDSKSIKQAVSLIRAQACERDRLNHEAGEGLAKVAQAVGEERDRRLNKSAEQLIDELTPINKAPSLALQQEMHEIQQTAIFAGQHARQDAQQQAALHMTAAAQRSTLIEKSASSLLALMSENPRPGRVKMKAAGSNLYVRNYEFEPEPSPVPLMAKWELMPSIIKPNTSVNKSVEKANAALTSHENEGMRGQVLIYGMDGRVLLHVRDNGSR